MRLLSWNVNHRASRRRVPPWVAPAIAEETPDVVVLTEYVEGNDHDAFVSSLAAIGLACVSVSPQPGRENQVLIATRDVHRRLSLEIPEIHPAVPSNALAIEFRDDGPRILGFRMPAFFRRDADRMRATWEWLLKVAETLSCAPTVITGDFNTAPGDPANRCGDCLEKLPRRGWRHARPASGCSWQHPASGRGREIDHLFLSGLSCTRVEYSWDFQRMSEDAGLPRVGLPDHAMLVADISPGEVRGR
jgi:hypothetical protein